ncbi:MAG TPA: ATP-binding protein [Planctomycetota bacterium]|nr:ATP-binding protein [Planctomycetota bacterium]
MKRLPTATPRGLLSWRRDIGVRIVAILLAAAGMTAAIVCVINYREAEREIREQLFEHGRSVAMMKASFYPDAVVPPGQIRFLETDVENLVRNERDAVFAVVTRRDGTCLAAYPRGTYPHLTETTILIDEPILVERGGEQLGTFHLGLSVLPRQAELRARTMQLLTRSSYGFLFVGVVLWWVLRVILVKPLRRLDAEAQRLGRGQLEQPLPGFGSTELGRLGSTLDVMRFNLRESYSALAEQNRRLLELDRLKSQFLANVSHEMRTPLTSVLGEAEQLADAVPSGTPGRATAETIQRNAARLLELVDRLLDLAKVESGTLLLDKRCCHPAEVIRSACEHYRAAATEKSLQLRVDVSALGDTAVITDPARLRQMVSNLVDNAVKFTDEGSVSVTARAAFGKESHLSVVVQDSGAGIPPQLLAGGIAAFKQGDGSLTRRHGGSGLGLYMTQQIARSMGGDVLVSSDKRSGTRVEITIKVERVSAPDPAQTPVPTVSRARVLVVDDARDNQLLLKTILTKLGHTVEIADNGRVAVERMKASRGGEPFDLVLMDLQMPELDGIGAIRELRALGFDLPIVSLTAHALGDDRDRCLAAGASGYETKPVSKQRLSEVVAEHVSAARHKA